MTLIQPWWRGTDWRVWTARLLWLFVLILTVSMLIVNAPNNALFVRNNWQVVAARPLLTSFISPFTFANWVVAFNWLAVVVYFAVALLIAWRRADDWYALLLSAALIWLAWQGAMRGDVTTWRYPTMVRDLLPGLIDFLPALMVVGFILLFFLFPDGRFVPGLLRWVAILLILVTTAFAFGDTIGRLLPTYRPFLQQWAWSIWVITLLPSLLLALIGQLYRYRVVATPMQRQQMKWVLLGMGAIFLPIVFGMGFAGNTPWTALLSIGLQFVMMILLPIALGFSVLRYRLWDIDIIINRTLVYGTLTAVILALYGLSVGLAGVLLPEQGKWLISLLALGVAAVVIAPAHHRLREWADHRLPTTQPPADSADEGAALLPASRFIRLAQAAWVVVLIFLCLKMGVRLSGIRQWVIATQTQYVVQESLRLFPASAAAPFAQHILALRLGITAVFWLTAGFIFWRKRDDAMALFVSFTLLVIPFGLVLGGANELVGTAILSLTLLLPFLFPDGRLVPRSTPLRVTLLVILLANVIFNLILLNDASADWAFAGSVVALVAAAVAGVGSQIYRYQHPANAIKRQQSKWFLFGLGIQLSWSLWFVLWVSGVLYWVGLTDPVITLVMLHLTILATTALPITIGIAILRYRLWDIDVVINRTLVLGGLTVLIATVYVVVVGFLGVLFQDGNNLLLSILATGLIAILFNPLRQRLQQGVNHFLYGDRDDPATVLSRLGQQLESAATPELILPTLVETVAQTLKLPYAAVVGADGNVLAETGQRGGIAPEMLPLTYQSAAVGELLVAPRSRGESFNPRERELLRDIARQAGAPVYAAQVTTHLQHSREQLVLTREEERRRLQRDLHDGLGPQLAGLSLKLDAARNLVQRDPAMADQLLIELKAQTQTAITDIRRLVYDLRPPALDQLGLVSALKEYAAAHRGHTPEITIDAPTKMPPLPAAVEVAAYRIATEALTNVVRHAEARHCLVRLRAAEGLQLEIEDDGQGLAADHRHGVGLSSMRERAAELGGTFEIQSSPGNGTSLKVSIPLESKVT